MSMKRIFVGLAMFAAVALAPGSLNAQGTQQGPLAKVKSIRCTFPVMSVGTWGKDKPEVQVKPPTLKEPLQFEGINIDEGTAELKSDYGKYDIIVRYTNGYLHFIQSFLDGRLYVTTILEKKTASGTFKAVHSRHEYTEVSLPGWTSSPEQYLGECELLS
jgi:hypothetical protein